MISLLVLPGFLGAIFLTDAAASLADDCRDDVKQLSTVISRRHPAPFRHLPESRFRALADSLEKSCAAATPSQRYFGLLQLAASPGDSHTGIDVPGELLRFPLVLNWFGDTLRVVQASALYPQVLGARVTGIGGQNLDRAIEAVGKYVQQHENEHFTRRVTASILTYPAALAAAGLIATEASAVWQFDADTVKLTVELLPAPAERRTGMTSAAASVPVTRQRGASAAWFSTFPDDRLVFVKLNEYRETGALRKLADSVFQALDATGARKLVFDFRLNGGSNYKAFESAFLPQVKRRADRKLIEVFALIGRATQSAPVVNAIQLKQQAGAILVGEPSGGRPNMLAEPTRFKLNHSGWGAAVSTHQHRFLPGDPDSLTPDMTIPLTWEDYRKGNDPAFEWIRQR